MNILQVAPYYPPYLGGQERHVQALSQHLAARGHEVTVLTSDHGGHLPVPEPFGVKVIRTSTLARVLRNPIQPSIFKFRELFGSADVIHIHNEHSFAANAAAWMHNSAGGPLILTCHGQLRFNKPFPDAVEAAYSRTLGAWTLKRMSRVITLSPTDRTYIEQRGVRPDRIVTVPNGIEFPTPPADRAKQEFRARYEIGDDHLIVFVGPILARKAPELLLKHVPAVLDAHPNTRVVFLGGGADLDHVKALAARVNPRRIHFTGRVSDATLHAAIATADVVAVTSLSEGLPTVILEALFHGVPVVASDLPPIRDWFATTCILKDPRSPDFGDALAQLIAAPEVRAQMGSSGRKYVERFSWDNIVHDIVTTYEEARNARSRGER